MASSIIECTFLIPICRDEEISDGEPHGRKEWRWLKDELYTLFGGCTVAPGYYHGLWKSPQTDKPVSDKSRKYIVALRKAELLKLRDMLAEACLVFGQQLIYLSVAGKVEFIEPAE